MAKELRSIFFYLKMVGLGEDEDGTRKKRESSYNIKISRSTGRASLVMNSLNK